MIFLSGEDISMRRVSFFAGCFAFLTGVILISTQPAYAYLDPGAGSAILQGIIAGLVAIGVAIKLYWHRLLKLVGIRKDKDPEEK